MAQIQKRRQAAALQSASREILTPDNQFMISGPIRVIRVIRGKDLVLLVAEDLAAPTFMQPQ
jgi:hypothetical protein